MGRFADLCGDIAAEADETPAGLLLPEETLARLHALGWQDDDISDALEVVHASFIQNELFEAADSLSARLVDVLGALGEDEAFRSAAAGRARLTLDVLGQLTRRVAHLERILSPLREGSPVDRTGFDHLLERLAQQEPAAAPRAGDTRAGSAAAPTRETTQRPQRKR